LAGGENFVLSEALIGGLDFGLPLPSANVDFRFKLNLQDDDGGSAQKRWNSILAPLRPCNCPNWRSSGAVDGWVLRRPVGTGTWIKSEPTLEWWDRFTCVRAEPAIGCSQTEWPTRRIAGRSRRVVAGFCEQGGGGGPEDERADGLKSSAPGVVSPEWVWRKQQLLAFVLHFVKTAAGEHVRRERGVTFRWFPPRFTTLVE